MERRRGPEQGSCTRLYVCKGGGKGGSSLRGFSEPTGGTVVPPPSRSARRRGRGSRASGSVA